MQYRSADKDHAVQQQYGKKGVRAALAVCLSTQTKSQRLGHMYQLNYKCTTAHWVQSSNAVRTMLATMQSMVASPRFKCILHMLTIPCCQSVAPGQFNWRTSDTTCVPL
jgi:hypothetical protein